jgi:hypothetical protein
MISFSMAAQARLSADDKEKDDVSDGSFFSWS